MVKRFALPERFPFDTSDANFAIANEAKIAVRSITSAESQEETSGTRAGDRERRRERLARRQKAAKSASTEESATIKSKSAQSTKAQTGAGTDATTRTLSASANGGSFYIYSITGVLLAEYSRSDNDVPVKDYIYVGGRLLAEYKPHESRTYFYTPDQINSTRIVTDDTGTVVYSAAHDPYGGMQKTWVNTYDPTPKFSGKERDSESGLDYFGARYYDRSQYRFISVDPIINFDNPLPAPEFWNLYTYCFNNPTSFLDPDGYQGITITRTYSGVTMTQGTWSLDNGLSGVTLELPWKNNTPFESCIKPGVYDITLYWWAKYKVWTLKLEDKDGREDILIHSGTFPSDTEGCILVGYEWEDMVGPENKKLKRSREAWGDIMAWYWRWIWEDYWMRKEAGLGAPPGEVIIEKVTWRPAY